MLRQRRADDSLRWCGRARYASSGISSRTAGDARLPSALYDDYLSFLEAVEGSIRGQNADEDLTNGYSLMADPYAARFPAGVRSSCGYKSCCSRSGGARIVPTLSNGPPRLTCCNMGPGDARRKIVTDALQYALRDQEDIVRKNALRALRAVYVGAKLHPDQDVAIEPAWLVEMLNSVVLSDRRSAAQILVNLTEDRDKETLDMIRERALASVLEMARWKTLDHALPAFVLAGRVAGVDEKTIKDAWVKEDRESVLGELAPKKGKKGK